MSNLDLEEKARQLIESGDYRVIRRYQEQKSYNQAESGDKKILGAFIDTETTGLHAETDKIIEIGIIIFEFNSDGRIFDIKETYGGLQDPGYPISEEITTITGITNEMLMHQNIDWRQVRELIAPISIVIAHNSNFDRKFLEKIEPAFKEKAWGCSMRDIDWNQEGIESSKLEYIAYKLGFYYEAHRAVSDCLAGIHVLSHLLPNSKIPALKSLLDKARESDCRVWAIGSPFDSKDVLKKRGYRWSPGENGKAKSWYIDIQREKLTQETAFLHEEIYKKEVTLIVDEINAFNRYSDRI